MRAFKVIYKHGHFIDLETKHRIIPVQGSIYTISAEDSAFGKEDSKLEVGEALNEVAKEAWIKLNYGKDNYYRIMKKGERLFFRIGNSKSIEGDEDHQYIFACTLLEDLYLYLLKGKKGDKFEHWRLANCICELDKCLLGGLALTDKIRAKSLNTLFSNTVQFYFSLQRSGSANAFNTFFRYEEGMNVDFQDATYQRYFGLSNLREIFVLTRP